RALGEQPGQDAGDGSAAGAVGTEDLAEEGPEGEGGSEELVPPGGPLRAEGGIEALGGEDVGEGQAVVLGERSTQGFDLVGLGARGTIGHRRPACRGLASAPQWSGTGGLRVYIVS